MQLSALGKDDVTAIIATISASTLHAVLFQ
jgi:hypothetical protein